MVINSYGKSPFEIRDFAGKEFKEIYDNQGRLLFKNWNEIQGSLPLQFKSYADYLKNYRIYGNSVQNGTPTPDNPIMPESTGERTGNLFDKSQAVLGKEIDGLTYRDNLSYLITGFIPVEGGKTYYKSIIEGSVLLYRNADYEETVDRKLYVSGPGYFTIPSGYNYIVLNSVITNIDKIMINAGSSPLPYEPYGYKIPVTVSNGTNSVTTPVYIGSEPLYKIGDYADYVDFKRGAVVRNIEKMVLTDETDVIPGTGNVAVPYKINTKKIYITSANDINWRCTHYEAIPNSYPFGNYNYIISWSSADTDKNALRFRDVSVSNISDFKSFISAQYSSGTPVTVWYVIDEPQEEPLESLLPIQTFKDSDVLTADTTVQPSEIYIKGKIR